MAEIEASLALAWTDWPIRIEIEAPEDDVRAHLPRHFAIVEPIDDQRCLIRATTSTLEWFAWRIAELPYPMTIVEPAELRDVFRQSAERLLAIADRGEIHTGTTS